MMPYILEKKNHENPTKNKEVTEFLFETKKKVVELQYDSPNGWLL